MENKVILPGATLGVLGGGQLGRMFCVAARTMGYHVWVLDPDPMSGAGAIADKHIQASYKDGDALAKMARACDAITLEFENIPAASVHQIAKSCQIFPQAKALEIAQNRHSEKQFAQQAGLLPVPYFNISTAEEIKIAAQTVGFPAILKSNTLGYDGKGQCEVNQLKELERAYKKMKQVPCVLEKKISIKKEISVIMARNSATEMSHFPIAENQHKNGILHLSIVPARIKSSLYELAIKQAGALVQALDYVGILAVEFFIAEDDILYFNEMAPRPHNSGHYTEDACVTSQFEQQLRMMCNLTPGDTRLISPVVMVNILGNDWASDWDKLLAHDNVKLHLYGKQHARAGRKMGHYNVLASTVDEALATVQNLS